jgi:hypothetical protein
LAGGTLTGAVTGTSLEVSGTITASTVNVLGDLYTSGTVNTQVASIGRLQLTTASISSALVDNFDVSGVGILFIVPSGFNEVINGFTGGTIGQVLHLVSANDPVNNCCSGVTLKNNSDFGIQKFLSSTDVSINSYQGITLVFDGTYWRILKMNIAA